MINGHKESGTGTISYNNMSISGARKISCKDLVFHYHNYDTNYKLEIKKNGGALCDSSLRNASSDCFGVSVRRNASKRKNQSRRRFNHWFILFMKQIQYFFTNFAIFDC